MLLLCRLMKSTIPSVFVLLAVSLSGIVLTSGLRASDDPENVQIAGELELTE